MRSAGSGQVETVRRASPTSKIPALMSLRQFREDIGVLYKKGAETIIFLAFRVGRPASRPYGTYPIAKRRSLRGMGTFRLRTP